MRANYLHIEDYARRVLTQGVAGDFAEFGVWHGTTFIPLAELCRINRRTIRAVDSFQGMAQETERDGGQFRKGALSVGGSAVFRKLCQPFANAVIHEGFVPAILENIPAETRFAFVHLDLDQYDPTLAALRWLWPRLEVGGVIACHDWFNDRNTLAAGAIHDWMDEAGTDTAQCQPETHHCFFIKE